MMSALFDGIYLYFAECGWLVPIPLLCHVTNIIIYLAAEEERVHINYEEIY